MQQPWYPFPFIFIMLYSLCTMAIPIMENLTEVHKIRMLFLVTKNGPIITFFTIDLIQKRQNSKMFINLKNFTIVITILSNSWNKGKAKVVWVKGVSINDVNKERIYLGLVLRKWIKKKNFNKIRYIWSRDKMRAEGMGVKNQWQLIWTEPKKNRLRKSNAELHFLP